MGVPVAFWLLPGEPSMRAIAQSVDELARRYDAPRFTPHVTLHVDRVVPHADLAGLLDEAAARFAPFEMRAGPAGHSPLLFKTLFMTLSGGDIISLAAALAAGVRRWRLAPHKCNEPAAAYRLEPHLSLLYKKLSDAERAMLAAQHYHNGESLYFDRIAAVTPALGARDLSRVEDWLVSPPRLLFGHRPSA
jgi:2'-5' RNA ligase superfamily protein